MTYHLHTENLPTVPEIVSRHFSGFTLTPVIGYWKGSREGGVIVEIVTTAPSSAVLALAADLRLTNRQESVLVESIPSRVLSDNFTPSTPDPSGNPSQYQDQSD